MAIATGAVGGQTTARRVVFLHAASFVLGFSVVFVALGALLGALGSAFQDELIWFQRVAGVLLVILGLHLAEVITIPLLYRSFQVGGPGGPSGPSTATPDGQVSRTRAAADYGRSVVVGVAFSVGWTPCVGPILAGILVLALDSASLFQAIILLILLRRRTWHPLPDCRRDLWRIDPVPAQAESLDAADRRRLWCAAGLCRDADRP